MKRLERYRWDMRFLDMAKLISSWSKDPSTQVGSVIVDSNNRVVSVGYNGFPQGISDDSRLDNRETKYKIILHAERNALLFAQRPLEGCTIYTYPFMPCPSCASMIIQSGISSVISYMNKDERWEKEFELSRQIFKEVDVFLYEYPLPL